jgi:hypothetical protein
MDIQNTHILSTFLFSGALAAIGCSADRSDIDPEELALESEELEELDDLVDEADDARSGGGGGACHGQHQPPKVTTKTLELWPPNHKYHEIDIEDCFKKVEACDPHWEAKILWASSDEPENGQGDGNTEDDIVCGYDDQSIKLRAERKGPGDGRVYKIKFEVKDSGGKKTTGICKVVVPHDQGQGSAVDSGEKYKVSCY